MSIDFERTDWTPEEALRFYADQKNFDIVDGYARILDNGAIASNALKHHSLAHLEMKGDVELTELRAEVARLTAENERLSALADKWNIEGDEVLLRAQEPVAYQHRQRGALGDEWQEWKTMGYKPQGPESITFQIRPLYARPVLAAQAVPEVKPKLIGWRTESFLWETADIEKAKNWEQNIGVLPIFEGDPNTKLAASPSPQPPNDDALLFAAEAKRSGQ